MESTGNENLIKAEASINTPGILSLLQGIIEDVKTLVCQQVELAVHELQMEGARAVSMVATAVFILVLVTLSMMLLLIASAAALHEVAGLPVWMSCCIIALVVIVGAAGLLLYLKQQSQRFRLLPFRTLHTVKEDIRWIKEWIASPRM